MKKIATKQEDGSYKIEDDPKELKKQGCGCWIAIVIVAIILAIYFFVKAKYGVALW